MNFIFRLLAAATLTATARAAETDSRVFLNANAVKWEQAPALLPQGAKVAVLFGRPDDPGPFTLRVSAPAHYKIPPHWHSKAESLTVISGTLYLGAGDTMDPAVAVALKEGGYHYLPARAHLYAMMKTPTVIQISGEGPFDVNYLDPRDDPQAAAISGAEGRSFKDSIR